MLTFASGSAFQARAILGAWQSGDEQRLRAEVESLPDSGKRAIDPGEQERLELLTEIAGQLTKGQKDGRSVTVYSSLLEHLAFPAKAIIPTSVWKPEAAAALLQ